MIAYGIGILPLICELRTAHPHATQPWYEYKSDVGGTFEALQDHMRDLLVRGPLWGNFPEPTKIILVLSLQNFQRAEAQFRGMGVRVVTRSRYLGGFIGNQDLYKAWLAEKVEVWMHLVEVLAGVARRHPHTACAGLKFSLQKEWDFVQSVTPHIREAFQPVEEALEKSFLQALFNGDTAEFPLRGITRLTVKQVGMAIPNLTLYA